LNKVWCIHTTAAALSSGTGDKHVLEEQLKEKTLDIRKLQQKLDLVKKDNLGPAKLCLPQMSLSHKIIEVQERARYRLLHIYLYMYSYGASLIHVYDIADISCQHSLEIFYVDVAGDDSLFKTKRNRVTRVNSC
jgi:hypothetical protein